MQQTIKLKIDYSKIKDFDDIPFHGDPSGNNEGLPKGFRGKEKEYFEYCKKNNIDVSKLTKKEAEDIIAKL